MLSKQKKHKEAIINFDKAIDLNPNECEKYYGSKGHAYYDMENFAQALIWYSKAVEINPSHYEYMRLKGLTLMYNSQYDQAIKCNKNINKLLKIYINFFVLGNSRF